MKHRFSGLQEFFAILDTHDTEREHLLDISFNEEKVSVTVIGSDDLDLPLCDLQGDVFMTAVKDTLTDSLVQLNELAEKSVKLWKEANEN